MGYVKKSKEELQQEALDRIYARLVKAVENDENLTWDSLLTKGMCNFVNVSTGNTYKGLANRLSLALLSLEHDGDPRFCTVNQASTMMRKAKKGKKSWVKKGSKSTYIWVPMMTPEKENEDGEMESSFLGFAVRAMFSVRQLDLIEKGVIPSQWEELNENKDKEPIQEVIDFFEPIPFKQKYSAGCPNYNFIQDNIGMPKFEQFHNNIGHAEALCHEMVHWTGYKKRLNRPMTGAKGTAEYSQEELIACLGSSFLMASLGIEFTDQLVDRQTAYLKSWISYLKDNMKCFQEAAKQAQRAVKYLERLNKEGKEVGKVLEEAVA
jgi:antirestriction protein ArdC